MFRCKLKSMTWSKKAWLLICLLTLTLVSCQTPDPEPTLTAEEIVAETAVRMNGLDGFHFSIERDGAPAFVDPPDNIFAFRRAEGDYVSPDKARATVRIIGPGLITDVQVITVAEIQWQTNPLTGQWEELPPNWGFDPTVLFDDTVGLQAVLVEDMTQHKLIGVERLEDGEGNGRFYHITGTINGDRLYQMSGTLIGPATVEAQLWINPDTFELVRARIIEPQGEETSIWQVDFSKYDQQVTIKAPDL